MNEARKAGLLAMVIFGSMFVANGYVAIHWENETSAFALTFGSFLLGFSFLMGLVQFIVGEFPPSS
jgi:hypothetical protein